LHSMNENELRNLILSEGGIKFGDFVLTSGKRSSYYIDMKELLSLPRNLKMVVDYLSPLIRSEAIGGVELGAVPIIVAASLNTGKPYIIIRKKRKHGTKSLLVGRVMEGMTVDIIEDVVTTGNSVMHAVDVLRSKGVEVKRCICIVDREEGGSDLLRENGVQPVPLVGVSSLLKQNSG